MPQCKIDNQIVEVPEGATILDAAEKLKIHIPTMCYLADFDASTSCMLCVVQVQGREDLVPACAYPVQDGMDVTTDSDRIRRARKTALELLLSDHLGDCMGPCHTICPARMNIPLMIRQIAAGQLEQAAKTIKRDIPLPAVLGRICPAPCENGCRRASCDEPVAIRLLKRYVADVDLSRENPYRPACDEQLQKKVAVIGAGPAGLSAAYYLQQNGIQCTIFDEHDNAGGMLRYAVSPELLPREVLEREVQQIIALGPVLQLGTKVGKDVSFQEIQRDFDAIFLAVGNADLSFIDSEEIETTDKGILINNRTYETSLPGVFAGGDVVRHRRLTVRAVADGKEASVAVTQYLTGKDLTGPDRPFNSRIGKIDDSQAADFLALASKSHRIVPTVANSGFNNNEAVAEAQRCLHCDCHKGDNCKLRQYSQEHQASISRYKAEKRRFVRHVRHKHIIYEPGKCIACGLCIQVTLKHKESLGLAFVGRGFDVRVAVPFGKSLEQGLHTAAKECAEVCPTGALALRDI